MVKIGKTDYRSLQDLKRDLENAKAVLYRNSTVKITIGNTQKKRDDLIKAAIKLAFQDTADAVTKTQQLQDILNNLNDKLIENKNGVQVEPTKRLKFHQKVGRIFYKREEKVADAVKKLNSLTDKTIMQKYDPMFKARIQTHYKFALTYLLSNNLVLENVFARELPLNNPKDLMLAKAQLLTFKALLNGQNKEECKNMAGSIDLLLKEWNDLDNSPTQPEKVADPILSSPKHVIDSKLEDEISFRKKFTEEFEVEIKADYKKALNLLEKNKKLIKGTYHKNLRFSKFDDVKSAQSTLTRFKELLESLDSDEARELANKLNIDILGIMFAQD